MNILLLLLWTAIALILRFANLDSKPPWTDEFSTLVFSLGNSFQGVPLDRAIALETLLEPLKFRPDVGIADVVHNLLRESNHPPIYFILAHWWMQLFDGQNYGSLWVARSLPALFGVASVPAIYSLAKLAFRSQLVSHCAAATMAVSPYGIYLAQEARHYTLAILFVIASLSGFLMAARHIQKQLVLPIWIGLIWIIINSFGIATHYFFSLTLVAETLVLIALFWKKIKNKKIQPLVIFSLLFPAVGTLVGGLIWWPIFQSSHYSSELTEWIASDKGEILDWISPIFQALAGWITMISLLPVESSILPVVIVSGIGMIIFFIWALPILIDGLKTCYLKLNFHLSTSIFGGFILAAIALFFGFTYFLGIDLTRGARYNFVYFPAAILLVGASLAIATNRSTIESKIFKLPPFKIAGQTAVGLILLMGLLSGVTVVSNLGYQKYYKPDRLVNIIRETSPGPILIATTHKTHVQTGELMGIAWEWWTANQGKNLNDPLSEKTPQSTNSNSLVKKITPQLMFLLAHQVREGSKQAEKSLENTLNQLQKPLDLWLVNFYTSGELELQTCTLDDHSFPHVDGYDYQLYHCFEEASD